jgi:hypothetical protein
VGISTAFKIFSYFPFLGVELTPRVMTYISVDAPQYKEQEYIGFRGKDLNSFQDIQQFSFPGSGIDPRGHDPHTSGCYLTQETRIYRV